MTIYLDRDFDATTLADLLTQVQSVVTQEWFCELESRVRHTYRDLAIADVKASRSTPADHPELSPGWFVESPYDVSVAQAKWEEEVFRQVLAKSAILNLKGD